MRPIMPHAWDQVNVDQETFYYVEPTNLHVMLRVTYLGFNPFEKSIMTYPPLLENNEIIRKHRWKKYFKTYFIRIGLFPSVYRRIFENYSPFSFKKQKIHFSHRFQCKLWYTIFQNLGIYLKNPMVSHV